MHHASRPYRSLTALLLFTLLHATAARGQTSDSLANGATAAPDVAPVTWTLLLDGRPAPWPLEKASYPADSLNVAAREALAAVQREGYYFARLDSATLDVARTPADVRLYLTRGPEVHVGEVRIEGAEALEAPVLRRSMDTRPGRPLDPLRLERDLDNLLARYERAGFPLAQIRIEAVALRPTSPPTLGLTLRVEEGPALRLGRIEVEGDVRTRPGYLARVAGLRPGRPLAPYDPDEIRRRLEATGFFRSVDAPVLLVDEEGEAVLRFRLDEEPPGTFDLVLGLLPPASPEASISFVGSGHLVLRNLLGAGREAALALNRLPGQASELEASVSDPYVLGLPFQVAATFEGLQQDSTFGKQQYGLEAGYRFAGGLGVFATLSREVTRPGQEGARLAAAQIRQSIAYADAWFAGLGVRLSRLDRPVNPRRGLFFETNLEQGRKERTARVVGVAGDTLLGQALLRQERLEASLRLYVPTLPRQALALGGDAALLRSDEYDESDLFRFGGATSLRGYDEDRFLGRFVARALAEYRYGLDRLSYAYAFFDLGYIERPAIVGFEAERGFWPGYGLGIHFSTDIGLVNASYAVSPEGGLTAGRVHVGLSFGL